MPVKVFIQHREFLNHPDIGEDLDPGLLSEVFIRPGIY
jgi:hypothetical protein